jgi:hypothetical protein
MIDVTTTQPKVIPKWHKPISLQKMRVVLDYEEGWKSLRNYLEAVEMERKRTIIRRDRKGKIVRHKVTLSAIARWAPEIIPPEVLGERGVSGIPNDAVSMRAVAQLLAKREDRMAETARNVFEARIKPHARRLAAVEAKVFPNAAIPR